MGEAIKALILINIPALTRHTDNIHKYVLGKAIEFLDVRQIYVICYDSSSCACFSSALFFGKLCYHTPIDGQKFYDFIKTRRIGQKRNIVDIHRHNILCTHALSPISSLIPFFSMI